jgi:hypothetical protein
MTGSPVLAFLLSTSHRDRSSGVEDLCNVDVALSAWELDSQAVAARTSQVSGWFRLSLSNRQVPLLTLLSGTQRARQGFLAGSADHLIRSGSEHQINKAVACGGQLGYCLFGENTFEKPSVR